MKSTSLALLGIIPTPRADAQDVGGNWLTRIGNIYTEVNTINKYSLKDKLTEIRE